ncbi:MAG: MarR family transcriptional regulator [Halobacteriota archaeon]
MEAPDTVDVLASKADATRYQILVEVAGRQPAVNQREIAEAIDVTSQAVSSYLKELESEGFVVRRGRGRYEVTKEGVDWLLQQTDALRGYAEHVTEDVVGDVEAESVVAAGDVERGNRVRLEMEDGVMTARPLEGDAGDAATAEAVSDAEAGEAVAVTGFEGILDYEPGDVTVASVPHATRSAVADVQTLAGEAEDHDVVAALGVEALAALRRADVDVDLRFGVVEGVPEAAARGLTCYVVVVEDRVHEVSEALSDDGLGYEVVEAVE